MSEVISDLLSKLENHPVLIDVGASGKPPEIWEAISKHSIYVGFDPDLRDIHEPTDGHFHQTIIVNEAVTDKQENDQINFYLTRFPHCSSALQPDLLSLNNFIFADLFSPEKVIQVRAITLNSVLDRLSLKRLDWLKLDTQGTDLRIFNSLEDNIRSHILAVDIEPGLIDAYLEEDLFVDVHKDLIKQGFWLANLNVRGSVRLKRTTLERVIDEGISPEMINLHHKRSPGWCEARYLRTIDWLTQGNFIKSDYILLWAFSMLDQQFGFSLDVGFEYERVFGKDDFSQLMINETISHIKKLKPKENFLTIAKRLIPSQWKQTLKTLIKKH